ncbi:unnamed protein product [Camellia sinensis]
MLLNLKVNEIDCEYLLSSCICMIQCAKLNAQIDQSADICSYSIQIALAFILISTGWATFYIGSPGLSASFDFSPIDHYQLLPM